VAYGEGSSLRLLSSFAVALMMSGDGESFTGVPPLSERERVRGGRVMDGGGAASSSMTAQSSSILMFIMDMVVSPGAYGGCCSSWAGPGVLLRQVEGRL
jgi:hypothetical protein